MTERIVFDAEPLIAHADDEPGSEAVTTYLDAVAREDAVGFVNYVNCAEVRYTIARKYDTTTADEYLDWLDDLGLQSVGVVDTWRRASAVVVEHNPALGDAFALATAAVVEGMLVVGGDDDYDAITDVPIERFRQGAA
jgi:predicted nucleic acid-binding protein